MAKVITLTLIAPNRKAAFARGRWAALFLALVGTLILTSGHVNLQWMGWILEAIAAAGWAYFARVDKDTPRMLMELVYVIAGAWGVYNWI
tara:strand:- start:79 stop:348 length:270 start_codon:yes stop_codon:yes gene_type:complete